MSVIIALKDKGRVVLGADKQSTLGNLKTDNETKLWPLPELDGAVVGAVGAVRAIQLIRFSQLIDKNAIPNRLDTGYIVNRVIPWIIKIYHENGIDSVGGDEMSEKFQYIPASFVIAYNSDCWIINKDLSVSEVSDYSAIGSGMEIALGALYASQDKHPFSRISLAIEAASQNTVTVSNSVDILTTDDREGDQKAADMIFGQQRDIKETKKKKDK